jgi:hypothetical protein
MPPAPGMPVVDPPALVPETPGDAPESWLCAPPVPSVEFPESERWVVVGEVPCEPPCSVVRSHPDSAAMAARVERTMSEPAGRRREERVFKVVPFR